MDEKNKEKKLKEIEELLKVYDGEMEIDAYVLKYLSFEELESIELNILKKQSNVIEENSEWLAQFKKEVMPEEDNFSGSSKK